VKIISGEVYNNSILVYLRANLTAQRPITKLALVCRKKQKTYKQKEVVYIIITIQLSLLY
jgi:hypothetical protein